MNQAVGPDSVIHVLTVGMDDRKRAIFRMAFKMYSVQRYVLVDDLPGARPHIAMVDMDNVDAAGLWRGFRDEYPDLPVLMVSVEAIPDAPAPVLVKPIRIETLFPALRGVLAGDAGRAPVAPVSTSAAPRQADGQARPKPEVASVAEQGRADEVETTEPPPRPRPLHRLPATIEHFDPRVGMLGVLRAVQSKSRAVVVLVDDDQPVLITMPEQERVVVFDWDAVRAAAVGQLPVGVRPPQRDDASKAGEEVGFSNIIWQVALWTSRGRLIKEVDINTPVRLRHWPNLTRLAPVPNGMRIAAFWVRYPVNLRLTQRMLNLPAEEIFDFLAATYSLGILDIGAKGSGVAGVPIPEGGRPKEGLAKEKGGVLSRLFRKVVGL